MMAIFEGYAGELSYEEYKEYMTHLKERRFSHLIFSLRHPYGIEINVNYYYFFDIYTMANAEVQVASNEVMQIMGASPDNSTLSAVPLVSSNDTPAQRERLAVLVSTGKSREAIGVQLTHDGETSV